jgi:hypothetical protein
MHARIMRTCVIHLPPSAGRTDTQQHITGNTQSCAANHLHPHLQNCCCYCCPQPLLLQRSCWDLLQLLCLLLLPAASPPSLLRAVRRPSVQQGAASTRDSHATAQPAGLLLLLHLCLLLLLHCWMPLGCCVNTRAAVLEVGRPGMCTDKVAQLLDGQQY